jgi:HEAT repeat protein
MTNYILAATLMALAAATPAAAQQIRFDDVIRNLRNPDPNARIDALRLLREARYPEAVGPIAALINDPLDPIQLEAIGAELSFFMVEDVSSKKRFAFLVEKRSAGHAAAAFDAGPLVSWPRPVPPEVIRGLLKAADDENAKVRIEAIYALGVIARAPFPPEFEADLIKVLDHYDPAMRAGAANVIGRLRVTGAGNALIGAVNDSNAGVRYAAIRALGFIRHEPAVHAITEQLKFYGRGEGAWSALDALARIASPASVPVLKSRLTDRDPYIRRAAVEGLARSGDTSEMSALEIGAGNDSSEMVRAAMAFALQKAGRNYIPRLVDSMDSAKMAPQVSEYLIELGAAIVPVLVSHLQDPDEAIRGNVALVLGAIGGDAALTALQPLTQDRDRDVARAATRAIERIKMAQGAPAAAQK